MKSSEAAASPEGCVAALTGWRRASVDRLRAAVRASAELEEVIRWGHLVYFSNSLALRGNFPGRVGVAGWVRSLPAPRSPRK